MTRYEPIIEIKGEFRLKVVYWFNEYDSRPYYAHTLFIGKKAVLLLPYLNDKKTIDQMIGMYKARLIRK